MIHKLDQNLAEDLCAQQVITNLTDCIKELVDNSIDACAHKIQIVLEDYGKKSIQVHDDGCGIKNFQYLGQKGSTSKNQAANTEIKTLGFRGEALHSIARVSQQMIIQSQSQKNPQTLSFDLKTFTQKSIYPKRSQGTSITIRSLFQFLPVRRFQLLNNFRDFLKKTDTLIKEYTLIFPNICFILKNIKSQKIQMLIETSKFKGTKESIWKNRIAEILGEKLSERIVYVNGEYVQGWLLSKIESGSSNENAFIRKNYHFMYLNKRPIDPIPKIVQQLNFFYRKYKKNTKYVFILNLKLDWKIYDINLAPNKREILMQDQVIEKVNEELRSFITDRIVEEVVSLQEYERKSKKMDEFVINNDRNDKYEASKEVSRKSQSNIVEQKKEQPIKKQIITKIEVPLHEPFRASIPEKVIPPPKIQTNQSFYHATQKCHQKPALKQKTKQKFKEEMGNKFREALKQRMQNRNSALMKNKPIVKIEQESEIQEQGNLQKKNRINKQEIMIEKQDEANPEEQTYKNRQKKEEARIRDGELGEWVQKRTKHSLKKQDFLEFSIQGQFNHGFIVCLFRNSYYLVDQHAASEKYHFQKLLNSPRHSIQTYESINMSSLDKLNLSECTKQLNQQGYHFIWKNQDVLMLTRVPVFLGKIYGKQHFRDLLENHGKLKDQREFYLAAATKACRTAVMVGHVLGKQQMVDIVRQLANLDSPWNCPHGRPTLIYLGDKEHFMNDEQDEEFSLS